MDTHYKSVFISDIHLWNPKNWAHKLLSFLKSISMDQLIICWDLFDFWQLNSFGKRTTKESNLLNYLNNLSQNWIKVTYLQWNHDRTLKCDKNINIDNFCIKREMFYTTTKNKKYFVCHWDFFDFFNSKFAFIWKTCNSIYSWLLRIEKFFKKHAYDDNYITIAEKIEKRIRLHRFSEERYLNKFLNYAKKLNCNWIIFWHYHIPEYESRNWVEYFNTWCRIWNTTAVVENEEWNLELVFYNYTSNKFKKI